MKRQNDMLAVFHQGQKTIPVCQKPLLIAGPVFGGRDSSSGVDSGCPAVVDSGFGHGNNPPAGDPQSPRKVNFFGVEIKRLVKVSRSAGTTHVRSGSAAARDKNSRD